MSEVVVPVIRKRDDQLVAVLDIDSDQADVFEQADIEGLEAIASLVGELWAA